MVELWEIRRYINLLEQRLGWDVILYDECGLLSITELATLEQTGKWHTNPYCLKIKSNKRLHRKCVRLKQRFVSKVLAGQGVVKSTCFCGVTEYAVPIRYQERLLCIVAATGFCGELPDRICEHLSDRVGLSRQELMELRATALLSCEEEEVKASVSILARLLSQYILEQTKLPALLDDADCEGNEHVLTARRYIAHHFTEPIQTDSVARHCYLSRSHLEHLFCKTLGHGVAEEIRLCRLQYAQELLCTTDYSVRYVSLAVGFSSPDYFATAFKKQFGLSPLQYRKSKSLSR